MPGSPWGELGPQGQAPRGQHRFQRAHQPQHLHPSFKALFSCKESGDKTEKLIRSGSPEVRLCVMHELTEHFIYCG